MVTVIDLSFCALPNMVSYSSSEVIRVGFFTRSIPLNEAFSVYPIKAGIAVSTSAMDGGKVGISFTYTPGVLKTSAIVLSLKVDSIIVFRWLCRYQKTIILSTFKLKTDRKSTRLNSSHVEISYAVFCLKKKKIKIK